MTTRHIEDIAHKRFVSTKYMPNSYRIFCEEISNDSMRDEQKYQSQAPPIYTDPMIVPAQAIEDRNHPHAGRTVAYLRENARTLNEPVTKVMSKHPSTDSKDAERRWWEWNTVSAGGGGGSQDDSRRRGKRSQSNAPAYNSNSTFDSTSSSSSSAAAAPGDFANGSSNGFQTTYQKDHNYMRELANNGSGSSSGGHVGNGSRGVEQYHLSNATRHGSNPNTREAVGIVPVNDLNTYSKSGEEQRVFVDKMSFEHQYDSRKDNNYPNAGKRQGAFVMEQVQPRPEFGLKTRNDSSNGMSIWELMQPENKSKKSASSIQNEQVMSSSASDSRNRRRDPIGYFSDTKYGDQQQQQFAGYDNRQRAYEPSWNNADVVGGNGGGGGGEPIAVNGYNQ